jgi:DNA-binding transcriptional MerR regulator
MGEETSKPNLVEEKLEIMLKIEPKFKQVYEGNYKIFSIRKDAELFLVLMLLTHHFSIEEIRQVMENSRVGKWSSQKCDSETREDYRDKLLSKAERQIEEQSTDDHENESQADRLVNLCLTEDVELFFDQHKTPFARAKMTCDTLHNCDICDTSVTLARVETVKFEVPNTETQTTTPKVSQNDWNG